MAYVDFRVAMMVVLAAIAVVSLLLRRRARLRDEAMQRACRGVPTVQPKPDLLVLAPRFVIPRREDLRLPGPYRWEDPPADPRLPTVTTDEPSWRFNPEGLAVEEIEPTRFCGTGVEPHLHPAAYHRVFGDLVRRAVCGRCRSHKVLVVNLYWCVNPRHGDVYWDIETRCTECGAFGRHVGEE
ncbi:MAG: hypothetical protein JRI23_27345 [Deltaproteobacteria bacterium]|jgi:hypothetical protein|nr:hypothetical protein [Deltaproteobacteria bacterium]MBW2535795.1 hypothetical protein [Deltaproteobacteria bacterium]